MFVVISLLVADYPPEFRAKAGLDTPQNNPFRAGGLNIEPASDHDSDEEPPQEKPPAVIPCSMQSLSDGISTIDLSEDIQDQIRQAVEDNMRFGHVCYPHGTDGREMCCVWFQLQTGTSVHGANMVLQLVGSEEVCLQTAVEQDTMDASKVLGRFRHNTALVNSLQGSFNNEFRSSSTWQSGQKVTETTVLLDKPVEPDWRDENGAHVHASQAISMTRIDFVDEERTRMEEELYRIRADLRPNLPVLRDDITPAIFVIGFLMVTRDSDISAASPAVARAIPRGPHERTPPTPPTNRRAHAGPTGGPPAQRQPTAARAPAHIVTTVRQDMDEDEDFHTPRA